jgi:hypothetical protein
MLSKFMNYYGLTIGIDKSTNQKSVYSHNEESTSLKIPVNISGTVAELPFLPKNKCYKHLGGSIHQSRARLVAPSRGKC